jgi:phosphatidate cytidylyltransferase
MHLKRWISGLVMAPCLILFVLFAPSWLFLLLILFLIYLGLNEYYALAIPTMAFSTRMVGILLGLLFPLFLTAKDSRTFLAGMTGILMVVYFGDTAAFYIGRTWGRKKLAPAISPGKTVEGGIGAIGGSIAGALFFKFFFLPQLPAFQALALAVGVSILGQMGDLFESLLKRSAQVKDSGKMIPGHGGLLDRIDSVLFAGPLVYFFALATGP